MKYVTVFLIILCIFAFFIFLNILKPVISVSAESQQNDASSIEEELAEGVDEILSGLDFSDIDDVITDLGFDIFDGKSFKQYVEAVINGDEELNIDSVWALFKELLADGIKSVLSPLMIVLCVCLLCVVFQNLQANKVGGVQDVVYLICFSVVVIIVSVLLSKIIKQSLLGVEKMQNIMNVVFPVLLVLMSAMGGSVSVQAYTPLIAILSKIISNVFIYVLLPLFNVCLVFSIIGQISKNIKLDKFTKFLKTLFKWIIGSVSTVFIGYLTIKGFTAGVTDGIGLKATKYAIKNYVPLLGGYISEGFELVKAGSLIVKNAVGFSSCIIVFAVCLFPVLSVAICELGLKLVASVVELLGGVKTANLLTSISDSLKMLVAIIVGVAVMYFLTIYLITCTVSNII